MEQLSYRSNNKKAKQDGSAKIQDGRQRNLLFALL